MSSQYRTHLFCEYCRNTKIDDNHVVCQVCHCAYYCSVRCRENGANQHSAICKVAMASNGGSKQVLTDHIDDFQQRHPDLMWRTMFFLVRYPRRMQCITVVTPTSISIANSKDELRRLFEVLATIIRIPFPKKDFSTVLKMHKLKPGRTASLVIVTEAGVAQYTQVAVPGNVSVVGTAA